MAEKSKKTKYTSIGGQALMEGILMRGPKRDSIALRLPDGSIDIKNTDRADKKKPIIFRIPIIRGIFNFGSSMIVGYKALMYSAEKTADIEEEIENPTKFDLWLEKHFSDTVMKIVGVIAMIFGLAMSLLLFKFLPMLAVSGIGWIASLAGAAESAKAAVESMGLFATVLEGIFKVSIFLLYVWAVGLTRDIGITYQYHGAEHKTIACYEAGDELTPENAAKHTRLHPRCGTSFMFLSIFIGVFVNFFVTWDSIPLRLCISLCLLPLTMGLGYEAIRLCGKHDNPVTRAIAAPGKAIQLITTKEPTLRQLEVAIAAMKEVIPEDGSDRGCCDKN